MTRASKQRLAGLVTAVCVMIMVFAISQMIPHGLAGETKAVKPYFALMTLAFMIGLPTAAVYQYYRKRPDQDDTLDHMRIEMDALSHIGQKQEEPKPGLQNKTRRP